MSSAAETSKNEDRRAPPGGASTVILGSDVSAWGTTSIAKGTFDADAFSRMTSEPRQPPGGTDSVQLGGPIAAATAKELLARPAPGGAVSINFGQEAESGLPAAELLTRAFVGGADSVQFGASAHTPSSHELLGRPWPGGGATIVLGGDASAWKTDSQIIGEGSTEAAAAVEAVARPAPGGPTSVNFNAEQITLSKEELMARPAVGGSDSVDFMPAPVEVTPAEELMKRPLPGGSATVVLGADCADWKTNSQAHGVGSIEALAAAETRIRQNVGGTDSIDFDAMPTKMTSEQLLCRPYPGGEAKVMLGDDRAAWATDSSHLGVGSVEAVAQAEPRSRPPPGGVDSVNSIGLAAAVTPVEELLARPPTGGRATLVLGGENADWNTSSNAHGVIDLAAIHENESTVRCAPGGVDSIVLGASDPCSLTVDELMSRPAPGGTDSVDFASAPHELPPAAELLERPYPGGATKVVLGSDNGAWVTSGQVHNGTHGEAAVPSLGVRLPPGGVDSVKMTTVPPEGRSVEELLANPAVGGAATVVLGAHEATWATNGSLLGVGCSAAAETAAPHATAHNASAAADSIDFTKAGEHVRVKPSKVICTPLVTPSVTLGDEGYCPQPGVCSNRFIYEDGPQNQDRASSRALQAPGGTSSIDLSDGTVQIGTGPAVSSNRFACGSNQNQGNWITDRSTTKLRQAPGGNSSICLSDEGRCPLVGVSSNKFANGSDPNAGNSLTDRSSTKVRHAPGGASSMCLGDSKVSTQTVQDENVNNVNIQSSVPEGKVANKGLTQAVRQAPGGHATIILG